MGGNELPIALRDARGRLMYSVGILNGLVLEVINGMGSGTGGGGALQRYNAVELLREAGNIASFLPGRDMTKNPPSYPDPPPLLVAVTFCGPDGTADLPIIGVLLDDLPKPLYEPDTLLIAKPYSRARLASQGCIVPVKFHHEWDANGKFVVAGDGVDGMGTADSAGAAGAPPTFAPGRVLGFATTNVFAPPLPTDPLTPDSGWVGVLIATNSSGVTT